MTCVFIFILPQNIVIHCKHTVSMYSTIYAVSTCCPPLNISSVMILSKVMALGRYSGKKKYEGEFHVLFCINFSENVI